MKTRNVSKIFALGGLVLLASGSRLKAQDLFDVFFLTDTTGSMGSLIGGVQTSSTSILDSIASSANVRFGVGEYKDAASDGFGFKFNLTGDGGAILSDDRSAVVAAINSWGASGGGDFPEDNLHGVRESAAATPWRAGSRRFIFWFGDAPGTAPARDGTTLSGALDALNENCIELIAVDLGSLDSTGQATTLTSGDRDCGDGTLLDGGELVDLDLGGLSDEEISAEVDRLITELFGTRSGTTSGDEFRLLGGSLRTSSVAVARTVTRDVGGRLFRMRSGVQSEPVVTTEPAPAYSGKGGMPKGGMSKAPITTSHVRRWEVYGQLYFSNDDQDAQYQYLPGIGPSGRLTQAETSTDIFGGTIGVEYDFTPEWSAGFAIGAAKSDVDLTLVGNTDIDTLALMPYVSYHRDLNGMGFYADLLYAYGMNDYDTYRLPGAFGSTDGTFNSLEFNIGLNLRNGSVVHGPYAQLRWLDGDVDGFIESGVGAGVYLDADYESVASQLGYQVSAPIAVGGGVVVPQGRIAWEHEFETDQGNLGGIQLGELDEDLAVIGAGVGYYMTSGWNVGLDTEARLGSETQSYYVGLKGGYEF